MLYCVSVEPVEWGSDGVSVIDEDMTFLYLDPSYSDKVDFHFSYVYTFCENVSTTEWLRIALNVSRYNNEMYNNFPKYFHDVMDFYVRQVVNFYQMKKIESEELKFIEMLSNAVLNAETTDELVVAVKKYQENVTIRKFGVSSELKDMLSRIFGK